MSILHRQFNKVFDLDPGMNPDMTEVLKLNAMIQIEVAKAQMRTADALSEIAAAMSKSDAPVDFNRLFGSAQNPYLDSPFAPTFGRPLKFQNPYEETP